MEAWIANTREALADGGAIMPMPESVHPLAAEDRPTGLYNGMVHPLAPFAIRGAVWYQGESNVLTEDGMIYHDKMRALINGWREMWGQGGFPFYFVQLTPYDYSSGGLAALAGIHRSPFGLPEIREAQLATLAVSNTGMVVTTDIGEARSVHPLIGDVWNLHPLNKQEVGRRLSLSTGPRWWCRAIRFRSPPR